MSISTTTSTLVNGEGVVGLPPSLEVETCYNASMKTYTYEVTMIIEVDAFDEGDAWEMLQDAYGVGENLGTRVVECEYKLGSSS